MAGAGQSWPARAEHGEKAVAGEGEVERVPGAGELAGLTIAVAGAVLGIDDGAPTRRGAVPLA